jgi:hypothetical protein
MDAAQTRSPTIVLEGKYLLTEEGVRYCSRNRIPLRDVTTRSGKIGTGFVWKQFNASFVQKLIANRLLGSIDVERPELLSKRPQLFDTTKLLIYGILYKKFRPTLLSVLLETDTIRQLVQRSPTRSPGTIRFPEDRVRSFVSENASQLGELKRRVLAGPLAKIDSDDALSQEDKTERHRIAHKFIDTLDNHIWYMFHLLDRTADRNALIDRIDALLIRFVEKGKIADYFAFMLLELIQMVESIHLETVAGRNSRVRPQPGAGARIASNPRIKDKISRTAEAKGDLMNLHYKFDTNPTAIHKRQRLLVSVTNSGLVAWRSQEELQEKKKTDVREIPLSVFYKQSGDDPEANLGLFYLSYLEEACAVENARFDANVFRNERRDETVTTLLLDI